MKRVEMNSGRLLTVAMILALAGIVAAQAGTARQGSGSKPIGDVKATVEGELVENQGSGTKGLQNFAIKVSRAVGEDGREVPGMKGEYLTFVDTARAQELIKKHGNGEKLVLEGLLKADLLELEVKSFKKPPAKS